jgi:uncharacterized cupredoxin-like copper-binding protein
MINRKLIAGVTALAVVGGGGSAALAAKQAPKKPPKVTTIKAVSSTKVKINRYIQDGLRFNRDEYTVRSGGTLRLVQLAPDEGPHTFTVVKRKDAPKTARQVFNCKVCRKLAQAHGADPNGEAPPKFNFLENGKGQKTKPNVNKAGDSAFFGFKKGDKLRLKVTAKKGKTLYFICIVHPWMQAKVHVR